MAHFAELDDNNVVKQVVVVKNQELLIDGVEVESKGKEFLTNLLGGNWIQTSINNNFRKQYASVGYAYDTVNDVFIAPQPYPSWALDNDFNWQPPTPRPDGIGWYWNEIEQAWVDANEL
jgi:hypothetical protein